MVTYDVKAPTPTQMISESSSHKRSSDRSNPIHCSNNPNINRPSHKQDSSRDDDHSPVKHTSRAEPCNCSTNSIPWSSVVVNGQYRDLAPRPKLKECNCREKDNFYVEVGVKLAEEKLNGAGCEKVC